MKGLMKMIEKALNPIQRQIAKSKTRHAKRISKDNLLAILQATDLEECKKKKILEWAKNHRTLKQ